MLRPDSLQRWFSRMQRFIYIMTWQYLTHGCNILTHVITCGNVFCGGQIEARQAWLDFASMQIVLDAMPTQQGAHQLVLPAMTSEDAVIELKVPLDCHTWRCLNVLSLAELISRIYCASLKLQEHIGTSNKGPKCQHGPFFPMHCNFWLSIEASSLAYDIVKPPLLWLGAKAVIPAPTCRGRATPSMIVPPIQHQLRIYHLLPICWCGDMDVPMLISILDTTRRKRVALVQPKWQQAAERRHLLLRSKDLTANLGASPNRWKHEKLRSWQTPVLGVSMSSTRKPTAAIRTGFADLLYWYLSCDMLWLQKVHQIWQDFISINLWISSFWDLSFPWN